jgi:hypothetical protein
MIGFIDNFLYNVSYSQSIIALPLIYPLRKSLGHAIRFPATDLSQEQSLQTTIKSSCHFLFNHFGKPTLQNSTQFSHPLLATVSRYIDRHGPRRKHVSLGRLLVHWSFISMGHGPQQKTQPLSCVTSPRAGNLFSLHCIATVRAQTTENAVSVFFAVCVAGIV